MPDLRLYCPLCLKSPSWASLCHPPGLICSLARKGNHWFSHLPLAWDWVLLKGQAVSSVPGAAPSLSSAPQTSRERGKPGTCPQGPEEQRLSPTPPPPTAPKNQSRHGKRWSSSKLLKPRGSGSRGPVHSPLNTHTPFFQGAWPQHPKDEPGTVLSSKQPLEPLSPPFPGSTWALTEGRGLPGAPLPLPQGSPESAPPPLATPPTRPGTVQEAIGSLRGKRTDPGEALRGGG